MYQQIRPLLFLLPPEASHNAVHLGAKLVQKNAFALKSISSVFSFDHPKLHTHLFGQEFSSPVGLAAGFDKNAELIPFVHALGFSFSEVGTITPLAQTGNPKPRLFRLSQDQALINRMGFNGQGVDVIHDRLKNQRSTDMKTFVNIGKNKLTPNQDAWKDYETTFEKLLPFAQGCVVNVSSPNTSGLRDLQEKNFLKHILQTLQNIKNKCVKKKHIPVLVKISPDLTHAQIHDILEVIMETQTQGVVITNTTTERFGLHSKYAQENGGLSGLPLKQKSTELIGFVFEQTQGTLPIIGVGGIFTAEDAFEKIQAGASLIEIYTGMIYQGPSIVKNIKQGLVALLEREGFSSINQARGTKNFFS